MQNRPRILIAEDEKIIAMDLKRTLNRNGYDITSIVGNAVQAIEKTETDKPDLILMDIMLGGYLDGIEAARIISYRHNTPIIYLSAIRDEDTIRRANLPDEYHFVAKPFKEEDLKRSIEIILERGRTKVN